MKWAGFFFFRFLPPCWLVNAFDVGTKIFPSQRQAERSSVAIPAPAVGCAIFGHCHNPTATINAINPSPPIIYIIGNTAPCLLSTAAPLVSDQTWLGTTRSRGGNTILRLQKNNFCGWEAAAAGSSAKNFSSHTGNEAPFKAPEPGDIYSRSEKIFKETY